MAGTHDGNTSPHAATNTSMPRKGPCGTRDLRSSGPNATASPNLALHRSTPATAFQRSTPHGQRPPSKSPYIGYRSDRTLDDDTALPYTPRTPYSHSQDEKSLGLVQERFPRPPSIYGDHPNVQRPLSQHTSHPSMSSSPGLSHLGSLGLRSRSHLPELQSGTPRSYLSYFRTPSVSTPQPSFGGSPISFRGLPARSKHEIHPEHGQGYSNLSHGQMGSHGPLASFELQRLPPPVAKYRQPHRYVNTPGHATQVNRQDAGRPSASAVKQEVLALNKNKNNHNQAYLRDKHLALIEEQRRSLLQARQHRPPAAPPNSQVAAELLLQKLPLDDPRRPRALEIHSQAKARREEQVESTPNTPTQDLLQDGRKRKLMEARQQLESRKRGRLEGVQLPLNARAAPTSTQLQHEQTVSQGPKQNIAPPAQASPTPPPATAVQWDAMPQSIVSKYENYKWSVMLFEVDPVMTGDDVARTWLEMALAPLVEGHIRSSTHVSIGFIEQGTQSKFLVLNNAVNPFNKGHIEDTTTIGFFVHSEYAYSEIVWKTYSKSLIHDLRAFYDIGLIKLAMRWGFDMPDMRQMRFHRAYWLAANRTDNLGGLLSRSTPPSSPSEDIEMEDEVSVTEDDLTNEGGWEDMSDTLRWLIWDDCVQLGRSGCIYLTPDWMEIDS